MNEFYPCEGYPQGPHWVSREVATEITHRTREAAAFTLADRIMPELAKVDLPTKPTIKDRLEADRVLRQ